MYCKYCNIITTTHDIVNYDSGVYYSLRNAKFCGNCGLPFLDINVENKLENPKINEDIFCIIKNHDWIRENVIKDFLYEQNIKVPSFVIATFHDDFPEDFRSKVWDFIDKNIHVNCINFIILTPIINSNEVFAKNIVKTFINRYMLIKKHGYFPNIKTMIFTYDIQKHIIILDN